jgi:hypothetical protein
MLRVLINIKVGCKHRELKMKDFLLNVWLITALDKSYFHSSYKGIEV